MIHLVLLTAASLLVGAKVLSRKMPNMLCFDPQRRSDFLNTMQKKKIYYVDIIPLLPAQDPIGHPHFIDTSSFN